MRKSQIVLITFATTTWATLVFVGFACLTVYSHRAGPSGEPPVKHLWDLPNLTDNGRYRLQMFAHPKCPCTRASLAQLAQVMSRCRGKMQASVWMFHPRHEQPSWAHTNLWNKAESIPGVTVKPDRHGEQASVFGVRTSGHVLLYDQMGVLAFSGGITGSRGHEGDNLGCSSVVDIVAGKTNKVAEAPVFGCSISVEVDDEIARKQ